MILDEPTSALDPETEQQLFDSLDRKARSAGLDQDELMDLIDGEVDAARADRP